MLSHAHHLALSPHQMGWAISFGLLQSAGVAAIDHALTRFRARYSAVNPRQRNPVRQPFVIAAAIFIFLAVVGMFLTIGRGWTLAIEAPILLGSFLMMVMQNPAR